MKVTVKEGVNAFLDGNREVRLVISKPLDEGVTLGRILDYQEFEAYCEIPEEETASPKNEIDELVERFLNESAEAVNCAGIQRESPKEPEQEQPAQRGGLLVIERE